MLIFLQMFYDPAKQLQWNIVLNIAAKSHYFRKKAPPHLFYSVLNMPLVIQN